MENQWEGLKCDCSSDEFVVVVQVRWRQSGGIVNQAKGYRCANCRKIAPIDRMIKDLQQRHLQAQIDELEEQKQNAVTPRDKVPIQKGNEAQTGVRS